MIEGIIKSIDSFFGYWTIRGIKNRVLDGKEVKPRRIYDFYCAKELIRRRDYHYSQDERHRRQYLACLSLRTHMEYEKRLKR